MKKYRKGREFTFIEFLLHTGIFLGLCSDFIGGIPVPIWQMRKQRT